MSDYEPLDLSALCNSGAEGLGADTQPITGLHSFHGLPFQIGRAQVGPVDGKLAPSVISFGVGAREAPLSIAIGRTARTVIVAHRLLESDLERGGPLGKVVAEYVFHYADGQSVRVPIRERFEIATVPSPWGGRPFLALGERKDALYPRYSGRWSNGGNRQTEVEQGGADVCYLWPWTNPRPEEPITRIEVVPTGPRFAVLAVTLGHAAEHPFRHAGAREIVITQTQEADAARPFGLEVEVDRGVATYPYPLPSSSADGYLADGFRGWGEAQRTDSGAAYVLVAAIPSATVTIKRDGEELGQARWGEVEERGTVETPRLRLELVDQGRNWVHTTVLDASTGKPVPCRIHFRSPEGIPYQPHGHHQHVNSNNGTWHIDVGGDLRLGQATYAYIDGRCQGWLPTGDVLVDIARGYEYEPVRERIRIAPGQRELTLSIKRWRDMNREGWFSGDSHVHFLSTQGSHAEGAGEDVNVVNLLQSQWGHLFTSTEEFTGRPSISSDGRTIVYASQENRQHLLGHMILLGLKEPVMPWCSDGPSEAEMGGTLETTLADWADRCHEQGGTVILPHFPMPNGEPAALVATGRVDAVEMIQQAEFNHLEYYRYLNSGYRLPLVGGTDKMTSDVPVGLYRTYVRIPSDEGFTYNSWRRHLALGRTFVSGGPLLRLTVDGAQIGDTVVVPGNGGTVEVVAEAESVLPVQRLEIVERGQVVAATEESRPTRRLTLRTQLKVTGHSWIAARVGGSGYYQSPSHHDGWRRGVFAHTSPIYISRGGDWDHFDLAGVQYMLTLVDGSLSYIRDLSPRRPESLVSHHHGEKDHAAFLERPFIQAREALHRRLHEHGFEPR